MQCPICHREIDEPASDEARSMFPFCSERCKLIDLGRWLSGRYQIPVDGAADEQVSGDAPGESGEAAERAD